MFEFTSFHQKRTPKKGFGLPEGNRPPVGGVLTTLRNNTVIKKVAENISRAGARPGPWFGRDILMMENINKLSAKTKCLKFLSTFAWSSHQFSDNSISQQALADYCTLSVLPIFNGRTEAPSKSSQQNFPLIHTSTCTLPFQNLPAQPVHCVARHQIIPVGNLEVTT